MFVPEGARRLHSGDGVVAVGGVSGAHDALVVAHGLRIPVHVEHVEQAFSRGLRSGLHFVKIQIHEPIIRPF